MRKREYLFALSLIISAAFTTGCASTSISPTNFTQRDLEQSPKNGIIIGTVVHNNDAHVYSKAGIYFSSNNDQIYYPIYLAMDQTTFFSQRYITDFQGDSESGSLFMFSLPEGNYAFKNFSFFSNGFMGGSVTYSAKEPFHIPFKVSSGKIIYIGEIKIVPTLGENSLGIERGTGGYFIFSDSQVRDIPMFKNKYHDLDWRNLVVQPIDSDNVNSALVQFE